METAFIFYINNRIFKILFVFILVYISFFLNNELTQDSARLLKADQRCILYEYVRLNHRIRNE
jgi:hypothetical protein